MYTSKVYFYDQSVMQRINRDIPSCLALIYGARRCGDYKSAIILNQDNGKQIEIPAVDQNYIWTVDEFCKRSFITRYQYQKWREVLDSIGMIKDQGDREIGISPSAAEFLRLSDADKKKHYDPDTILEMLQ